MPEIDPDHADLPIELISGPWPDWSAFNDRTVKVRDAAAPDAERGGGAVPAARAGRRGRARCRRRVAELPDQIAAQLRADLAVFSWTTDGRYDDIHERFVTGGKHNRCGTADPGVDDLLVKNHLVPVHARRCLGVAVRDARDGHRPAPVLEGLRLGHDRRAAVATGPDFQPRLPLL